MSKKKQIQGLQTLPGVGDLFSARSQPQKPSKATAGFFEKFDTGTGLKLELFEGYTRSWFPVFFQTRINEIHIYDYFCGPGKDAKGNLGSPLRTVEILRNFHSCGLVPPHIKTKVYFSDDDIENVESLKKHLDVEKCPSCIELEVVKRTFEESYPDHIEAFSRFDVACLLIIDPFGLALNKEHFQDFLHYPCTDFLLFQPMSQIHRFCERPGFTEKFPGLSREKLAKSETAHQDICNYMIENWIPANKKYYLKAFAIQKEKGQKHGVIFGSGNVLGIYKFIQQCWKQDDLNGEANFAFAGDLDFSTQPCLFENFDASRKVREFKQSFRKNILLRKIINNRDVFYFALSKGFYPPGAPVKETLKQMKREGLIEVDLRMPLSYEARVLQDDRLRNITLL